MCGTAAELREMAEAIKGADSRALSRARDISASRLSAYRAKHPHASGETLRGKVVCDTATADRPRADVPRLRVLNQAADSAELWLYDYIDSWGAPFGISAAEVVEALADIDAPRIDVHINSPGGEVFEGIAIKRALAAHPADIYVCVDSIAASIASVIAMAGDTIGMERLAMMMIHDASGFCVGNAADMLQMAALLDKVSDTIAQAYTDRAGESVSFWRARMLDESWYTAAEAIDVGLADEYLDGDPADDEPEAVAPLSLLNAFAAAAQPQPEPPVALSFLRGFKEATKS